MTFDVIWFYAFACLPFVVGGMFWIFNREVTWGEWLINSAACFLLAGTFHLIAVAGATADVETWSGHVVKSVHYPRWVEEYQQMHTRTVGSGKNQRTEIYYTTEYRTHHEHWEAYSNIDTQIEISQEKFHEMARVFGSVDTERPHKSGFYSGDPNIYVAYNRTSGEYYPVTDTRMWSNKIKATPSTFSFAKVPETTKGLFEYPKNDDPFRSDRLLGTALATIDSLEFDRMNARLGPRKQVNVIMIGMGSADSMLGEWQRSKWIGGKKNDVVIMWGGNNKKPDWVKVFGWTDSELCKRTLESIVLNNGATTQTLPLIEAEIRAHYVLKDWDKAFAHIRIPAPAWSLWTYFSCMVVFQIAAWFFFMNNENGKEPRYGYYGGGNIFRVRY